MIPLCDLLISPALRMVCSRAMGTIVVHKADARILACLQEAQRFYALFAKQDMLIPLFLEKDTLREGLLYGRQPNLIGLRDVGVFSIGSHKAAADWQLAFFTGLLQGAPLPDRLAPELPERTGPVNGKVAVITGAAQGLGKGIAEGLAAAGAYCVLADLNAGQAEANSAALNMQYGQGCTMAVKVDVGNEQSVQEMVAAAVAGYGGIDILVSNAGILKAGSLDEISLADFELTTKINYTAFFLCTKYASLPMKIQHQFNNEYMMDIIQVNSKSGLQGSKKNFSYAGAKFGGIGLTESFALELVEHNIKVNAVCPGNFFEGPLWSDPEKGLFVQYLKANKVPGALTIADVKRYYENQVPMKRGCRITDVVKAILYIIDQPYETGQALPVTGGQVMLG